MMTVRTWLEVQGLGQYADSFERNAIEPDLLPALSEAQLEKLGVQLLGHRLRLLQAIATLRTEASPRDIAAHPQTAPTADADRRQLTVLFCDLGRVNTTEVRRRSGRTG